MAARGFLSTPVPGCGPWPGLATACLQLATSFQADGRDTSWRVRGSRLDGPHPRPAHSLHPLWPVSISENKTWPGSGLSYLQGRLGNMWSELHFMKAAATHDTLSIPGDLWGCLVLMVSVGLVSSPIRPGRCLRDRWVTSLPRLDRPNRKVWLGGWRRGGGRGLATQASLGGAAAGKPLGAHPEQPINPGDLRAAGSLPAEVSQGSRLMGRGRCLGAPVPHGGWCQGPSPRARPSRLSRAEPADE